MVVTLNAVVVCKQQTFGMVNTIGHLSFVCNLSVYHSEKALQIYKKSVVPHKKALNNIEMGVKWGFFIKL